MIQASIRALIVEDDSETGSIVAGLLEDLGLVCTVISPPTELSGLLAEVRRWDADVVILDQRLGQSSAARYLGVDAWQYLLDQIPALETFILTSYDRDPDVRVGKLPVRMLIPKGQVIPVSNAIAGSDPHNRQAYLSKIAEAARTHHESRIPDLPVAATADKRGRPTREFVRQLASRYWTDEPSIESVVWFRNESAGELRLLCVDRLAIPNDEQVLVFRYPPDDDIPFALEIGELTPDEWSSLGTGKVDLPAGWDLLSVEEFRKYPTE